MDKELGERIKELKDEGLYDDAYIFFYSDHGGPFPRHKRAIFDSGIKVPLMIKYPNSKGAGKRVDALLSFIDLAPTVLEIADIKIPEHLQGNSFLNNSGLEREYLVSTSDRFDEEVDRIRSIKTKKYKLIKNYYLDKSHALPIAYRQKMPMMQIMSKLYNENKLNKIQSKWFDSPKKEIEFYDIENDPNELNDLSNELKYQEIIFLMLKKLDQWILQTNDLGEFPESKIIEKAEVD